MKAAVLSLRIEAVPLHVESILDYLQKDNKSLVGLEEITFKPTTLNSKNKPK